MFTHDTLAKLLVEDRHRDIRAHAKPRRRQPATRRWSRARTPQPLTRSLTRKQCEGRPPGRPSPRPGGSPSAATAGSVSARWTARRHRGLADPTQRPARSARSRSAGRRTPSPSTWWRRCWGPQPSTITNAPDVGDVGITADILTSLGVGVDIDGDRITVEPDRDAPAPGAASSSPASTASRSCCSGRCSTATTRHSFPWSAATASASARSTSTSQALEAMGAEVEVTADGIAARADRLRGARITLPYPSVGATETVLLTAVLAEGRTVLRNAAVEPEVTELALFLQRMGARIGFRPDRRIVIEGVERLGGAATRLPGRPPRGVLVPGGRAHDRRPGAGGGLRPGPAGHRHRHAPAAWAPASRSPTSGSRPAPRTACAPPPCRPTPTPGS